MNRRTVNTEDADREDSPDRTLAQLPGGGAAAAVHADFTGTGIACADAQDRDLGGVRAATAGGETALSAGTANPLGANMSVNLDMSIYLPNKNECHRFCQLSAISRVP